MSNADAAEMPRYKCHKEVHALKIAVLNHDFDTNLWKFKPAEEGFDPVVLSESFMGRHKPEVGGYYVVYRDGYKSFSPAKAFEEGYALIR